MHSWEQVPEFVEVRQYAMPSGQKCVQNYCRFDFCSSVWQLSVRFSRNLAECCELTVCDRWTHGNESFRYHGTERTCALGVNGYTTLCTSPTCNACSIIRTSFEVTLSNPGGAWVTVRDLQVFYSTSSSELHASDSDRVFTRHLRRTSTSGWCQWS